jgi:hypothetical protein
MLMTGTEDIVLLLHTSNGRVKAICRRVDHVIELLSVTERQVRDVPWIGKSRWAWNHGLRGITSLRLAIGSLDTVRRTTLKEGLWCGGSGSGRLREIAALRGIVALQVIVTLRSTVIELLLSTTKGWVGQRWVRGLIRRKGLFSATNTVSVSSR